MQNENDSQNRFCFFGEKFSEQAKNSLRKDVCKDLPVEFEQNEKFYCVLHFPNNQKWKNTNFIDVVKQRIDNQENNFCGVYFPGKTDYFSNRKFETDAIFERTFFEDAFFNESIFIQYVSFSFANLQRANFQECQFHKQSSFIETTFASEIYQREEHLAINFSAAIFADAIFRDCIFNKHPHFNDNVFEEVSFFRTKFLKGVSFFSTKFNQRVSFSKAIFNGTADFNNVIFDCDEKAKDSAKKKSFYIASSFRNAQFQDVRFTNTVFESIDFHEVIFQKVQFWQSTFNGLATFESATFKVLDFYQTKFLNEAHFNKVIFQGKGGFFWSEFIDKVQFNKASFENTCDILFNFTAFKDLIDFSAANVSGYLSFNGSDKEKVFFDKSDLNLEFIRIENPEKIAFHTVDLHPYWFINVDSRKFTFANIDWGKDFGNQYYKIDELKKISKRGSENPEQIFKISCRQLAENAENNNRFEEASKFRRMAFETESLERKEKVSDWWSEEFTHIEFFQNVWAKIKTFPYDILHFIYRWTSSYGESWSWAAFVLLFLILIVFPFIYTNTNFYVCPVEKTNSNNASVCETRTLTFGEGIRQSLATATLQNVEMRKPNSPASETFTILEKIFAPLQAALLALAIRRKFMR